MNQTSDVPPIITKIYDVLTWLLPQIEKFPRVHRYVLGKRLEEQLYQLLNLTIDAAYTRDERRILIQANLLCVLGYDSLDVDRKSSNSSKFVSTSPKQIGKAAIYGEIVQGYEIYRPQKLGSIISEFGKEIIFFA